MIDGFLNINKAPGMTSHDVVAQVRKLVGQKRVGHGGTLDPMATGVLPVALGTATRLVEYLVDGTKTYEARIHLGATTTTDDAEGEIIDTRPVPALAVSDIEAAFAPFIGNIQQIPPQYSAIQVGGQRMYDLARQGQVLDLAPRTVEIERIDLLAWQSPDVDVRVVCGKGTYIRAIARDLGAAIGCGAHLVALRRTRVGPLDIAQATTLEQLRATPALIQTALLPPTAAVTDWPEAIVDDATAARIGYGMPVMLPGVIGERARAQRADGTLLALLRADGEHWQPFKVFQSA